jgi:ectoine hydroxylase-related dioxygenase (phytanoyl-CoA dioxygenase family)
VGDNPPRQEEPVTSTTDETLTTARTVSDEVVDRYQRRGFVHIPRVFSGAEVDRFRDAATAFRTRVQTVGQAVFSQYVDVWQRDETLAELTRNPRLAGIAERLQGSRLRIWHDQILVKDPHNGAATEFHQDRPYWPHAGGQALSAWVALVDVPVDKGCMTFIPGSQRQTALQRQDLNDHRSLMSIWPEAEWKERITLPLRAGDCTFHNAYTAHTANPNDTDEPRLAQVVIYMDADTTFTGAMHPVTDPLGLTVGATFPEDRFPSCARLQGQ